MPEGCELNRMDTATIEYHKHVLVIDGSKVVELASRYSDEAQIAAYAAMLPKSTDERTR